MVTAFLGTVIGLERAVALDKLWAYAAPLFAGVGGILAIAGYSDSAGPILVFLSSVVLVVIYIRVLSLQFELFNVVMAVGAVCLAVGNLLWVQNEPIYTLVMWWAAFIVLTITGERLELSRVLNPSKTSKALFILAAAVFLIGVFLLSFNSDAGLRIAGIGMIGLSLWLAKNDVAKTTVKQQGLTRYVAVCLLSGYVWLAIAGVASIFVAGWGPGYEYDAILHSLFLGFAFTMIFGHAPIIFPAILKVPVPYRPVFYSHLVLLHLGLLLRVGGDFFLLDGLRMIGGAVNVIAILLFLVNTVSSVVGGLKAK
jgi:hypothetical protein